MKMFLSTLRFSKIYIWSLFLLFPLISSCSSQQNQVVEIITPPVFPKDYDSIPDEIENSKLQQLESPDNFISSIEVGRKDPFLPPLVDFKSSKSLVPDSFQFLGHISMKNSVNAFVAYQGRSGTIEAGDLGGSTTDLLPSGWSMENIDLDSKVLTLKVDDESIEIFLFPTTGF